MPRSTETTGSERQAKPRVRPRAARPAIEGGPPIKGAFPGPGTIVGVIASYVGLLAAATFPVVLTLGTKLAGQITDPLMHLWLIRWARTCLVEGRSPFFCPDVHYPVGVPLGFYPTMHLPTVLYLILGQFTASDTVRINLIWATGIVGTGVAAFLMAWWAVRHRGAAWLAGLSVMLSGPMLLHAHGHTELILLGSFPAFLVAWIGFVDRPSPGRLVASVALLLLMTMSAPYFLILGVFPAAWYAAWSWVRAGSGARRAWLVGRIGWLVGFAAATLPGLAVLFSSHLWAAFHGYHVTRPKHDFFGFRAPPWGYLVPTPENALGKALVGVGYGVDAFGGKVVETSSYLGVVSLALLIYAAARRVRFPRAGYWWSALAMLVVLSLGGRATIAGHGVMLPTGWLWSGFPPFRLIRVPSRFNLFAVVAAAVPVAAGLRDLLGRLPGPAWRGVTLAGLTAVLVADLAMVPFPTEAIPPLPGYYRDLARRTPRPAILDAPSFVAAEIPPSTALWGYWQSLHGGTTTATYTSHPNDVFDALVVEPSPWSGRRLADPDYLRDPTIETFGAARGVALLDYAWLFLTVHRLDYVVLHQGPTYEHRFGPGEARLKALLERSKLSEDGDAAIYDRAKLPPPTRPTWLCAEGWRRGLLPTGPWKYGVFPKARVVLYLPGEGRDLTLSLVDASAFLRPRVVRIVAGGAELARWTVETGAPRTLTTPPFRLPAGSHDLTILSDGDDPPVRYVDRLDASKTPYSFRLDGVEVRAR